MSDPRMKLVRIKSISTSLVPQGMVSSVALTLALGVPAVIQVTVAPPAKDLRSLYMALRRALKNQQDPLTSSGRLQTLKLELEDGQRIEFKGIVEAIAPAIGGAGMGVTITMQARDAMLNLINFGVYRQEQRVWAKPDTPDRLSQAPVKALEAFVRFSGTDLTDGSFRRELFKAIDAVNQPLLDRLYDLLRTADFRSWDAIKGAVKTQPDRVHAVNAFQALLASISERGLGGFDFVDAVAESFGAVYIPHETRAGSIKLYADIVRARPKDLTTAQQMYPSASRVGLRPPVRQVVVSKDNLNIAYGSFLGRQDPNILAAFPSLEPTPDSATIGPPLWLSPTITLPSLAVKSGYSQETITTNKRSATVEEAQTANVNQKLLALWARTNAARIFFAESNAQCVLAGVDTTYRPGDRVRLFFGDVPAGIGTITQASHTLSVVGDAGEGTATARTMLTVNNIGYTE